ncbi:spore coat protein GerQ [Cytobacillus sp. FJAT-53684]|uniref:Spore coat protein GerQ n=1 Tax=Cytobacillus mangrovibacter TaxID=3299024 RepID=A0ABW6K0Y1_9BACI
MSQNFNQYTANPYYGYQQPYTGGTPKAPAYGVQPIAYQPIPPGVTPTTGGGNAQTQGPQVPGMLPIEQSYIENILRLNKGKLATVYTTFENNSEWNAKKFEGIIEAAGRDHVIISDPQSGMRYLIPMVYLDYVTFDEEIEYDYPSFGGSPGLSQYNPR